MDSYEYYLLFHKDSSEFINALSDKNDQVLLALEMLLKNSKISYVSEKESCLTKIWSLVKAERDFSERLETIFKMLLKQNQLSLEVKLWMFENLQKLDQGYDGEAVMRVIRNITEVFIAHQDLLSMFEQVANVLIDLLFREKSHQAEIIDVLQLMMTGSDDLDKLICERILDKSRNRDDRLAFGNLCYFFEGICKQNFELDNCELLRKYFESSEPLARKQGLYLIKCLIQHKKLAKDDEESFKKFTIVVEALQESPHLILPTLKLIQNINFTETFSDFTFILLHMTITHESAPVKNWGLSFILNNRKLQHNDRQIVIILNALNSTTLYDPDDVSLASTKFNDFIKSNFEAVFRSLTQVNWTSVPLYRIMQVIEKGIQSKKKCELNELFVSTLRLQTDVIPNRVKNLVIRSGLKLLFSRILLDLSRCTDIKQLIPLLKNVFGMSEQHDLILGKIFQRMSKEDVQSLFSSESLQPDFIRFVLTCFCHKKDLSEVKEISEVLPNHRQLLMEGICELASKGQCKDEVPFFLIHRCIEELLTITESSTELSNATQTQQNVLRHGLKFLKLKRQQDLCQFLEDSKLKTIHFDGTLSFDDVELLLELHDNCDVSMIAVDYDRSSAIFIRAHFFLRQVKQQGSNIEELTFTFEEIKSLIEECESKEELSHLIELIKCLTDIKMKFPDETLQGLMHIIECLSTTIAKFSDRSHFVVAFVKMLLMSVEPETTTDSWIEQVSASAEDLMGKLSENDKLNVVNVIIEHLESSNIPNHKNSIKDFVKGLLVAKVIETDMMTREQRIEMAIGCEVELMIKEFTSQEPCFEGNNAMKTMRLRAAEILADKFQPDFAEIVECFMEDFAIASKKKPRYFPNSWIHRMKLHSLQPIVLGTNLQLSERTIEILIDELLYINNQPNVTYLIEIILARYRPNVIELLKNDTLVAKLKAPAVKSIFAITIMQLKMEDAFTLLAENFFGIAEVKLEEIHDIIMPFTMGQNYGVRSNAQAAITLVYKHVKSLFGARESSIMLWIAKSCAIINDSVKFKNAARFFESLKQDFRFTLKFDHIWTIDVFYHHIPLLTNMSFEEVIVRSGTGCGIALQVDASRVKIATENETETLVMKDEMVVPNVCQPAAGIENLQQKYLPHKYQIPGDKIMKMLPSIFQDVEKPRSSLTVVASLVSHAPNLGGLARTCEIFGVSNYVIESLKLTEHADFKALSKTAEKWLKISEIKQWKLFDYLMGMKLQGYTIVGAEQSGNSVSLVNAEIPERSVLLLGNENEGIPANLLSLLDLTIELPQTGVVRSLNVHVTGAIVIWEYAKQHLFKTTNQF